MSGATPGQRGSRNLCSLVFYHLRELFNDTVSSSDCQITGLVIMNWKNGQGKKVVLAFAPSDWRRTNTCQGAQSWDLNLVPDHPHRIPNTTQDRQIFDNNDWLRKCTRILATVWSGRQLHLCRAFSRSDSEWCSCKRNKEKKTVFFLWLCDSPSVDVWTQFSLLLLLTLFQEFLFLLLFLLLK